MKSLIIPAGKQIKIPRKKTNAIDPFGSLNLSDRKKYDKIKTEGTIVIKRVVNVIHTLNWF